MMNLPVLETLVVYDNHEITDETVCTSSHEAFSYDWGIG